MRSVTWVNKRGAIAALEAGGTMISSSVVVRYRMLGPAGTSLGLMREPTFLAVVKHFGRAAFNVERRHVGVSNWTLKNVAR